MKKAFTLIELLVVIAIIAILAAMLMPALSKARKEAQKAACSANVHNLGLGWAMFRKDFNGDYSRENCDAWDIVPDCMADVGGLGYIKDMGAYKCPALDTPFPRNPSLEVWTTDATYYSTNPEYFYTGSIDQTTYFADEKRVHKNANEQRAILADGIEIVTMFGKEPANHSDYRGRVEGANVLYVDNVVQWTPIYKPEHPWVLSQLGGDQSGSKGPPNTNSVNAWPTLPNSYGWCAGGNNWFPHVTQGTWRRFGFIQNTRLLKHLALRSQMGGGWGRGEDDCENYAIYSNPASSTLYGTILTPYSELDVDDIYFGDCHINYPNQEGDEEVKVLHGDPAAFFAFVEFSRGSRCCTPPARQKLDCSLAGGNLGGWRGHFDWNGSTVPLVYGGVMWGWPDETWGP